MTRRKDFGDQYPSDIGDVPPVNPTDNFSEIDYSLIDTITGRSTKPKPNDKIQVPKADEIVPEKRAAFTGVITKIGPEGVFPRQYTFLRQDLRHGLATAWGNEGLYNEYRVGDQVDIIAGQFPNTYVIVGSPRQAELPVLDLRMAADVLGNGIIELKFTEEVLRTGAVGILPLFGGGIKLNNPDVAILEINFHLTIECATPKLGSKNQIFAQAACVDSEGFEDLSLKYPFKTLRFDKSVGFQAFPEVPQDVTSITISGHESYYMAYQPAGGGPIVWTNWPVLHTALTIGAKAPQGWLHITNEAGGLVGFAAGQLRTKYIFPDNAPTVGSHLVVEAVQGEAVKLKHLRGGTGTVSSYNCYAQCQQHIFKDGLIISGPGISMPDGPAIVALQDPVRSDYDPC